MHRRRLNPPKRSLSRAIVWLVLMSCLAAASLAAPAAARADGWEAIADGIDYRAFVIAGPNRIFVTRMDRSNPNVTLETSIAKQRLSQGKQTVSSMAEAYDGALSAWEPTWGARMDVVAAINGSFHDTDTGVPLSGMVHSGWYAKRFDDLGGGSGFAWRLDRQAFIGSCVSHPPDEQIVTFLDSGEQLRVNGINSGRRRGSMVLYTPQWDARTPASSSGVEVLVQMDVPAGLLAWPDMATGRVTGVRPNEGSSDILFDHVVLSAAGKTAELLEEYSHVGARVGISSKLRHYENDCQNGRSDSWSETYAALSGSFDFLLDGEIQSFDDIGATSRHPRTAVCYNDEYLYFVVVDGRNPGRSVGMTMEELGRFCRDSLGAGWGINQDGGGSSALWVDGEIVNQPSDGSEREVANGLMMVVVEPPTRSDAFQPGDRVEAVELFDFSVGPGANYQTPSDVRAGDPGTILSHPHGLEGIQATGQHWWFVEFDGRLGWAPEDMLALVEKASGSEPTEVEIPPGMARFEAELQAGGPIKLGHWSPAIWLR